MSNKNQSILTSVKPLLRAVFSLNRLIEIDKGTAPLLVHTIPDDLIPHELFDSYEECRTTLIDVDAEVKDLSIEPPRKQYLLDVVSALIAQADEGAGADIPYRKRVEQFTGLPGEMVSRQKIAQLQENLSIELARAGYHGSLTKALNDWREQTAIDPNTFVAKANTLFTQSLSETRTKVVALPEEATIEFQPVHGVYYRGYSDSAGPYRAHITLNADLEWPMAALKHVISHEGCPGHFAISACRRKQAEQGLLPLEERFFFANTPVTSINEGTCNLGVYLLGWFDSFDDLICLRSDLLRSALLLNMCFLFHEYGQSEEEVVAYYKENGAVSEASAAQTMRFVKHPLWHTSNPHYWHGTNRVFDAYHRCMRENRMDHLIQCLYREIHTYHSLGLALGLDS